MADGHVAFGLYGSENKGELMMMMKCRFTSTETVALLGTGAQDVHLDFHTAPERWGASYLLIGTRPFPSPRP